MKRTYIQPLTEIASLSVKSQVLWGEGADPQNSAQGDFSVDVPALA